MMASMKNDQPTKAKGRTCACGHGRAHRQVTIDPEYTVGGWFLLLIGVTATPTRLNYRCRRCNEVFDSTTDPALLEKHV